MKLSIFTALFIWFASNAAFAQNTEADNEISQNPVVQTEYGKLKGQKEGAVNIFRGIPYAAPPVKDLRWQPPKKPLAWEGVREATTFSPSCIQPEVPAPFGVTGPMSEDCLTLNIWTLGDEGASNKKRPVLFWIHGGAFIIGSSSQPIYDGTELAKQNVVVVTINYRLGALGFLAHPSLSAQQKGGALGNYGLLDQIAALHWVHENIDQFSGDADNITLMGESSGGVSVTALMTSPMANGLFAKAIAQSAGGTAIFPKIKDGANSGEKAGQQWAVSIGLDKNASVNELREISVNKISTTDFFSFPNIDNVLLKRSPGDAFEHGEQMRIPLLSGANSYEGSLKSLDDSMAQATLPVRYKEFLSSYKNRETGILPATEVLRGELFFVQPSRFMAEAHAKIGAPSYLYYFDQVPSSQRDIIGGTPHGGELPYLFGVSGTMMDIWDEEDQRVSNDMMQQWIHFASTGDPNVEGMANWPVATPKNADSYVYGDEDKIKSPDSVDKKMLRASVNTAKFFWKLQ